MDAGRFSSHDLPGRCWRHGERTFAQTANHLQHRVDQCMAESPAFRTCRAEAAHLYAALACVELMDVDTSGAWGGVRRQEHARVAARAEALLVALTAMDPAIQAAVDGDDGGGDGCKHEVKKEAPPECALPEAAAGPKEEPLGASTRAGSAGGSGGGAGGDAPRERKASPGADGSGGAAAAAAAAAPGDSEVAPRQALMNVCLLLAAMFERSPFLEPDVRRRVLADFTTLKRDFRHGQMRTLHGPTTSIDELFGSVKDLDKAGLIENMTGIVFDDWVVSSRADCFLNAELDAEVTCLTQDGPIGVINVRLRTFIVLSLLQERLVRELFESSFAGVEVRGFEKIDGDEALDFYDFTEAMARNTPNSPMGCTDVGTFYAWMYAPEVNATPDQWAEIFGQGANKLPSLYGAITTPDDTVLADEQSDSGYSMDMEAAMHHDYSQTMAQAAIGFPFADDLLGTFLGKLRDKKARADKAAARAAEHALAEADARHAAEEAARLREARALQRTGSIVGGAVLGAAGLQRQGSVGVAAAAGAVRQGSGGAASMGGAAGLQRTGSVGMGAGAVVGAATGGAGAASGGSLGGVGEVAAPGGSTNAAAQSVDPPAPGAPAPAAAAPAPPPDADAATAAAASAAATAAAAAAAAPATPPVAAAAATAAAAVPAAAAAPATLPVAAVAAGSSDDDSLGARANNEGLMMVEAEAGGGDGGATPQVTADAPQPGGEGGEKKEEDGRGCNAERKRARDEGGGAAAATGARSRSGSAAPQPPARAGSAEAARSACAASAEGPGGGGAMTTDGDGARAGPGPGSARDAAAAPSARRCGGGGMTPPRSRGGIGMGHHAARGPVVGGSGARICGKALPNAPTDKLPLPLGVFLVGLICSGAFTNTQLHIEDLMLMSININIFGAPKIWYWVPRAGVPAFKAFAETLSPGGRDDLYTKAVAPFIMDKKLAEHRMPLSKLRELGVKRSIQMPGMAMLTSPGYAFHFTVSMGLNVAESCNLFLQVCGYDVPRIWAERPLEQYPDPDNSMARWMYDNGLLNTLGLDPGPLHLV